MCEKVVRPGRAVSMAGVDVLGQLRPWCAQTCTTGMQQLPASLSITAGTAGQSSNGCSILAPVQPLLSAHLGTSDTMQGSPHGLSRSATPSDNMFCTYAPKTQQQQT